MCETREKLLEVKDLHVEFGKGRKKFEAIKGVSFDIYKGETFGLVGESGSGKTTIGRAIIRINPVSSGEILFKGKRISGRIAKETNREIVKKIQMIFQDPMTCLNPTMKVGRQLTEAICQHRKLSKDEAKKEAVRLLEMVQIPNAAERAEQYPHEFSGGMRQRAMIAMAMSCEPKLLIADEPTTALDVTIQAQIMQLMAKVREETGTAIILITHDLGVVANLADRVAVMYAGKIVETGTAEDIFYRPKHPYTQALLKSLPTVETSREEKLVSIAGTPPDLFMPPKGCEFASRCEHCMKVCKKHVPPTYEVGAGHKAVCWRLHPACPAQSKEGN